MEMRLRKRINNPELFQDPSPLVDFNIAPI
jgi:hypothetical protein